MIIDWVPLYPAWKAQAGGSVSDGVPQEYAMEPVLDYAVFSVSGSVTPGKYAGAEWYLARPIPTGSHAVCHSFEMELSASSLTDAQAEESDLILTGAKETDGSAYKYNRSFQINAAALTLQIAKADGSWVNFASIASKLMPNIAHKIQIFHTFDFVKKISSTTAVAIDADLYLVPVSLQNVPAVKSNWTDYNQVIVQMQLDLTQKAGAFSETVGKMKLMWT